MNDDFDSEEPTPVMPSDSMAQIMEGLRSPGIETLTSERPTKPIKPLRPIVREL